ncbi:MAG: hypothetical protein HYS21_06685 [Deltaproteobacteria bacterium]|nr:hypothetical protein [Deltaproteobacteria bacterium]
MKKFTIAFIFTSLALLFIFSKFSHSAESRFRQDFRTSYEQNRFDALGFLIRSNKNSVPAEVKGLIAEAMGPEKSYGERMQLLDLASAMASMYKHWFEDDRPLKEVEPIQKTEIQKENARLQELRKWDKFEKIPGNFVMRTHQAEMDAKGLAPVLYPHWMHRLFFECKTCHQDIFKMKRGGNGLSQSAIQDGKLCGKCHNGTIAFDAGKDCEKCHMAGKPESDRLVDVKKADLNAIKEAASKIGSVFKTDGLPGGVLPSDRFGQLDWEFMKKANAYTPLNSLTNAKDEIRDNTIYFDPPMPYIKGVLFDHKTHSSRIKCDTCHNDIFKDELGANKMSMVDMGNGKFCGYCHTKVSFKMAECNRCHSGKKDEKSLMRKPAQK